MVLCNGPAPPGLYNALPLFAVHVPSGMALGNVFTAYSLPVLAPLVHTAVLCCTARPTSPAGMAMGYVSICMCPGSHIVLRCKSHYCTTCPAFPAGTALGYVSACTCPGYAVSTISITILYRLPHVPCRHGAGLRVHLHVPGLTHLADLQERGRKGGVQACTHKGCHFVLI